MKKLIVLLLAMVMVLSIMSGCRRQTDGTPGDPTVNNTTTPTVPTMTSPITRPSTDSTMNTTTPDSTEGTGTDATGGNNFPDESATNSDARSRTHVLPRR